MSRVGKYPVELPQGVQVAVAGRTLTAKGKLGELRIELSDAVEAAVEGNQVTVSAPAGGDASLPVSIKLRTPAPMNHDY